MFAQQMMMMMMMISCKGLLHAGRCCNGKSGSTVQYSVASEFKVREVSSEETVGEGNSQVG